MTTKRTPSKSLNRLILAEEPIAAHEITAPDSNAMTSNAMVFNFAMALPGKASSRHTERAYFRWVDEYLVTTANMSPTRGIERHHRMAMLPVPVLRMVLTAPQLRAWLGMLQRMGHGKQGLDQARAAVVTLADLLAESGWLEDTQSAALSRVSPPKAEEGQRMGRWLSIDQIHLLMNAARQMAVTENQRLRNSVVMSILCTMALRREELSQARWGDLSLQNNRVVLRVHGKGKKGAFVDMPRPVVEAVNAWRAVVTPDLHTPMLESPLVRRLWRNGHVSRYGISDDGIWRIVGDAAEKAGIGHVAPHDLRRSVAGALNESGVPIEKISRLLRHSNVAVTERYINRLPKANEGAILMSDLLGLEDTSDLWNE